MSLVPIKITESLQFKTILVFKLFNEQQVKSNEQQAGVDPEILKSWGGGGGEEEGWGGCEGGAVCRPPWLADEENFSFQMIQKGQNNVRN